MNSVDPEAMMAVKPKLTPVLKYYTWETNWSGFVGHGVKGEGCVYTCVKVIMVGTYISMV